MSVPTHPPSLERPTAPPQILRGRAPRTRFVDRVAMRVGLALLLWGTRPVAPVAPDVSGYRPGTGARDAALRDIDTALAAHRARFGAPTFPTAR
ncbi:MAG TPA: hypothetical protein VK015_04585 [Microbacterium sp.]|nr:hypothetical protein [Microbacterium sp.]